jgi:prolyl 4-hydroxylase
MASQTLIARADALLAAGHRAPAIALVRDAAGRGDVDALFRLATWHLIGQPLPRDVAAARALLHRAIAIGHVDAALMEIAFTANGSGGPPDWSGALRLLRTAASGDPVAASQLALVERMALNEEGLPPVKPSGRPLSDRLDVRLFPALCSAAECAHIAQTAAPMLAPAEVVDPATGRYLRNPVRTSHAAIVGPAHEDLVIRAINRRIAAASDTDVAAGEPLTVLHYAPGQEYRPHHDAFAQASPQRDWTMLIYLNEGYRGGGTAFPKLDLTVEGRLGDGLLFRNTGQDGLPDPLALHAGLPVTAGAKWLCTRWIRTAPYDPWGGGAVR